MFGSSSSSSAYAQGGFSALNSSGWTVGGGKSLGGNSGPELLVWLAVGVMAVMVWKKYKGAV